MSRTTADRECQKCGWTGHVPEDVPYECPNCRTSLVPQPFDYASFIKKLEEKTTVTVIPATQ